MGYSNKENNSPSISSTHNNLDKTLSREDFLKSYSQSSGVFFSENTKEGSTDNDPLSHLSKSKGYRTKVEDIRPREFKRLEENQFLRNDREEIIRNIYFDNSANCLYPEGLVDSIRDDLRSNIYSNPHSHSPSASQTHLKIEKVRRQVLDFFEADPEEYTVIFTQNATKAMQLVAENFPWSKDPAFASYLFCTHNAHTSLLGMRGSAIERGAHFVPIQLNDSDDPIIDAFLYANEVVTKDDIEVKTSERETSSALEKKAFHLFAYPGQCNFTGQKFRQRLPPSSRNLLFLLDGASLASTSPISLKCLKRTGEIQPETTNQKESIAPHFLAVSFYKIFGLPTGLGALIARKDSMELLSLHKSYFGGGSVSSISFSENWLEPHASVSRRFEDGTLNFLDIIGLGIAINYHLDLYGSMSAICGHTTSLMHYIYSAMSTMHHFNGAPAFVFYPHRPNDWGDRNLFGPIVSFNILRTDSSVVGPAMAHSVMAAAGFHIRSGTFCNPGGLSFHLASHSNDPEQKTRLVTHRCGEERDLDESGVPLGALRISLGAYSTWQDAQRWLSFLADGFIAQPVKPVCWRPDVPPSMRSVTIYPIKSCRGFQPTGSWPIVPGGLQHDRIWMLIGSDSRGGYFVLNQKRVPRMALIAPKIKGEMLFVSAPGMPTGVSVFLSGSDTSSKVEVRLMGRKAEALCYMDSKVDEWFISFLGIPCRLARMVESESPSIHLANEAPFLLITEASLLQLSSQIPQALSRNANGLESAFRANFMISGNIPSYAEDKAVSIQVGSQFFKVLGKCRRCRMVNICQDTAVILPEPYLSLSKYRSEKSKLYFGVHLVHLPELSESPYTIDMSSEVRLIN